MLQKLVEGIEAIGNEMPLLLILEGLHWADEATLDLLSCLGQRRTRVRRMIIGSYRPEEVALTRHSAAPVHFNLLGQSGCMELPIKPLRLQERVELISSDLRGRRPIPDELIAAVSELGDGNPLVMRLCLDAWSAGEWDGPLSSDSPCGVSGSAYALPEALIQIAESQVRRLTSAEQRLLQTASIAGKTFSTVTVARALGEPVISVELCCEQLARRMQLIRRLSHRRDPDRRRGSRYGFIHAFVQKALHERLSTALRIRLCSDMGLQRSDGRSYPTQASRSYGRPDLPPLAPPAPITMARLRR